jgi:hypothetical protein
MTVKRMLASIGAAALVLSVSGIATAEAQQRDRRRESAPRGGDQGRTQGDQGRSQNDRRAAPRAGAERSDDRRDRGNDQRTDNDRRDRPADRQVQGGERGGGDQRYGNRGPRVVVAPRPAYANRYGNNNARLSVFFGLGSGYRYGVPYYDRVYGYSGPTYVGVRRYYGDVRLQVNPRNAEVFVDGYYAGIVDDFDGVFQRLTLTVGRHEISIELPGLEPQVYWVNVDPTRTINVRTDLYQR